MTKQTFEEIVAGLELEYPKGPILKSAFALSVTENLNLLLGIQEAKQGNPYNLIKFFTDVLPIDQASREMLGDMTINEMSLIMNDWGNENLSTEGTEGT
jgi:hypothetical protein